MASPIEIAALELLRAGLSVIPAANKRPSVSKWKPYQKACMQESAALQLFHGAAQIALICGQVSGGVEVLDIDLKYDLSGTLYKRFKQLLEEAAPGLFYKPVIQSTVSGGCHMVYRCAHIEGNEKLASRATTDAERAATYSENLTAFTRKGYEPEEAAKLAQKAADGDRERVLIETRGEGGYIICAPSEGYRVMGTSELTHIPTITPDERRVLLSVARSLNEYLRAQPVAPHHDAGTWELSPGDDYDARGDVVALLEKHGWRVVGQQNETVRFLRPGETTSAYSANWNQIPGRFWVWSTSTQFTPEVPYKPYAVYAMLECRGDFKEAAKKLLTEGYGRSKPMQATAAPKNREVPREAQEKPLQPVYIRVGTTYYKRIETTDVYGNQIPKLVKWTAEALQLDHGKDFLKGVPKFDSFVMRPSHTEYEPEIGTSYNIYNPLTHEVIKGDHPHIDRFIEHVFGDKSTLFWDYLTILWRHPKQILPILCLVSEARQTGKTTVFDLLRAIFQSNAVILKNENFQTQFNAHFVGKLLLMIDENYVDIDKKRESERIKSMATQRTEWMQFKGKDSEPVDFFGKLLMTANNKEFIKIDREEIRYLVIEVPKPATKDPHLLDKMVAEIPALLFTLNEREIHYPNEDRAWFSPELLYTETLTEVVNNTRTKAEQTIDDYIQDCLDAFCPEAGDDILMTPLDIYSEIKEQSRNPPDHVTIIRYLKRLGLKPEKQQAYTFYRLTSHANGAEKSYCGIGRNGKPYRFCRKNS